MTELITAGEPMGLFIAQEKGSLKNVKSYISRVAGADLNVAIGVARLGHQVKFVSQIGVDTFGCQITDLLLKEKIDVSYLQKSSIWKTGFMLKNLSDNGEQEVDYYRKDSAASHIQIDKMDKIDFTNTNILHLGGILAGLSEDGFQATLKLIKLARKNKHIEITFDPNLRPTLWNSSEQMVKRTNAIAKLCDVVMPNIKEGRVLTGKTNVAEIADYYLQNNSSCVKQVIINLVEKGSYSKHKVGDKFIIENISAIQIPKIIDRVGAGDGFVAGIISGKLESLSDKDCLLRGSAIGVIQMQNIGDNEGLPNRRQLDEFIDKYLK